MLEEDEEEYQGGTFVPLLRAKGEEAEALKELMDSMTYSLDLFQPRFDTMDHFDTSTATSPPLFPLLQVRPMEGEMFTRGLGLAVLT